MSPLPENLLVELRAELADVRSLLIEALGDFTIYQEGLLKLQEREKKVAIFYRRAFVSAAIVLALVFGFGSAQLLSTNRNVRETKNIAEEIQGVQDGNKLLLEEVDCTVRAAATIAPKDLPAAYLKCLQPKKG